MPVKAGTLLIAGSGAIVLWAGLKGKNIFGPNGVLRAVITGKDPNSAASANQISPLADNGQSQPYWNPAGALSDTGSTIDGDALQYQGFPYKWAGAPGTQKGSLASGTDCSGFVNAVIGRDLGLAIPGYRAGTYDGSSHGPATVQWWSTGLCSTISQSQAQPGDLFVWWTHMGVYIGNGQIISALDTTSGVIITSVTGATPPAESKLLRVRRYNGPTNAGTVPPRTYGPQNVGAAPSITGA